MGKTINLKKNPSGAFEQALSRLKQLRFDPDYVITAKKELGIEDDVALIIRGVLHSSIKYSDLLEEKRSIVIRNMRLIAKVVERKKTGKSSVIKKKSLYGGGNFFDGKKRKPVNKQANLGTIRK